MKPFVRIIATSLLLTLASASLANTLNNCLYNNQKIGPYSAADGHGEIVPTNLISDARNLWANATTTSTITPEQGFIGRFSGAGAGWSCDHTVQYMSVFAHGKWTIVASVFELRSDGGPKQGPSRYDNWVGLTCGTRAHPGMFLITSSPGGLDRGGSLICVPV